MPRSVRRHCWSWLLVSYAPLLVWSLHCDQEYLYHSTSAHSSGSFASPLWPDNYPENVRCRYRFLGQAHERVWLTVEYFNVEGLSEDCRKDYVDVYSQVESSSSEQVHLDREHLLGRFCGHQLNAIPNHIVSVGTQLILDFFSGPTTQLSYNQDGHMGLLGFNGSFKFIADGPYNFGVRSSHPTVSPDLAPSFLDEQSFLLDVSQVGESADSSQKWQGNLLSPAYPGYHPGGLNYTYIVKGPPGSRVRLAFLDLDLFDNKATCPLDYVQVFDGPSVDSQRIQRRLCGNPKSLILFSSGPEAMVQLVTQDKDMYSSPSRRNTDSSDAWLRELYQRRGFHLQYEVSREFLRYDQAELQLARVPGTECDLHVKSLGRSAGEVTSPGFGQRSLPANKSCKYYFYGVNTRQQKEVVQIDFLDFNLPSSSDATGRCSGPHLAQHSVSIRFDPVRRTDRVLTFHQKPERVFCGTKLINTKFTSRNSIVVLHLNTSGVDSLDKMAGFRVKFHFHVDFGIRGHMLQPGQCHFQYSADGAGDNATSHIDEEFQTDMSEPTLPWSLRNLCPACRRAGLINSPFFEQPYPHNSSCRFDFQVTGRDFLRIVFHAFRTLSTDSTCQEDYVIISEIVANPDTGELQPTDLYRFCGQKIPGLIISNEDASGLIIRFHSDHQGTTSGFLAQYEFIPRDEMQKCNSSLIHFTARSGVLHSPNYPHSYPGSLNCEWTFTISDPAHNKLLLHFVDFQVEGGPQSCSLAVVNVFENRQRRPTLQLCGTDSSIPAILTNASVVTIKFLTAANARGSRGFRMAWTEVLETSSVPTYLGQKTSVKGSECQEFVCKNTQYCIEQELECNGVPNCGTFISKETGIVVDNSDELSHCTVPVSHSLVHVGAGVALTLVFLLLLVTGVVYRERRFFAKHPTSSVLTPSYSKNQPLILHEVATPSARFQLQIPVKPPNKPHPISTLPTFVATKPDESVVKSPAVLTLPALQMGPTRSFPPPDPATTAKYLLSKSRPQNPPNHTGSQTLPVSKQHATTSMSKHTPPAASSQLFHSSFETPLTSPSSHNADSSRWAMNPHDTYDGTKTVRGTRRWPYTSWNNQAAAEVNALVNRGEASLTFEETQKISIV